MSQIKEQVKAPEKQLNKMEASILPDTELKTMVIRMLNEFRGIIDKFSENLHQEREKAKRTTVT